MKKAIKISLKSISILSAIVILVASFSLFSFADSGRVFTMPLNQPIIDANHGYLEYVVESPSYTFTPVTLSWVIYDDSHSVDLSNFRMSYDFEGLDELLLIPTYVISSPQQPDFNLFYYVTYGDGTTRYYHYSFNSTTDPYVRIKLASGYKFYGFKPYGLNFDIDYNSSYYPTQEFSFVYSQNAPAYETLLELYSELHSLKVSLSDSSGNTPGALLSFINSSLNSIESDISDVESVLRSISSNVNSIKSSVDDVEDYLEEIRDLLSGNGEEAAPPPPPVDSDDAEDQMNQMDDFVSGSGSQDVLGKIDDAFDSDNLNAGLDTTTSGFLWDVLDQVLDTSPEVFGMLISLLSYGLISLLLGR